MNKKNLTACLLVSFVAAGLAGCSGGDVDPQAKVDAPGYYNGEMKPKGTPKGGEDTTTPPATTG